MLATMKTISPLIAGNWKMNKLPSEAETWAVSLKEQLIHFDKNAEILICAPFTHLAGLHTIFADSPVSLGAQDVSQYSDGAYTGEISAAMLKDIGVQYVIIGHSERREYHKESDSLVNAKVKKVLEQGLRPILCVGESLAQREAGQAETIVVSQLKAGLEGVSFNDPNDVVIAYEPIWAIGTGKTATSDDAQTMSASIRKLLIGLYPEQGNAMRILYGGSMKPSNAKELLEKPDVNGGLIGGASLKIDDLVGIIQAVS
jgi:triosephosphate isomerase (TIM)